MGCIQSRQVPYKTEFPAPSRPAEEVEREEAAEAIRQRAIDAVQEADRAAANERRMKEKVQVAERRALESAQEAERAKQHAHRLEDPDFDPLYVESEEDFTINPESEKEEESKKMSVRDAAAMFEGLANTGEVPGDKNRSPRKLCMPGAFKELETFEPAKKVVDDYVKPPPGGIIFPDEKYVYNPNVRVKAFAAPTSPMTPPTFAHRNPLGQHVDNIIPVNGVPVIHEPDKDRKQPKDGKQQQQFDVIQKVAEPDFKYSPTSPVSPTMPAEMSSVAAANSPSLMIPLQWAASPTMVESPSTSPSLSIPPIECPGAVESPLLAVSSPEVLAKADSSLSIPPIECPRAAEPPVLVEVVNSFDPLPSSPPSATKTSSATSVVSPKSAPLRENKAAADVLVTRSPRLNAKLAAYEALDAEARAGPPPPGNLFIGQGSRVSGNLAKYEALDAEARAGPPPRDSSFTGQGRRVSGNLAKYEALDAEARAGPPPPESLFVGRGRRVSGNLAKYEALDAEAHAPLPPPDSTDSSHKGYAVRERLAWSNSLEKSIDEYGDESDFGHHSVAQIERRQQELFERAGIRATREKPAANVSASYTPIAAPTGLGILKHLNDFEQRDAVAARGLPTKVESPPPQALKVGRLSGMLAMYEARDKVAEEEQRIESIDRRLIVAAKTRASLSSV